MKKIMLTAITTLLLHTGLLAAHQSASLSISMEDRSTFTLVLDNSHYARPEQHYQFRNLDPGYHVLRIFRWMPGTFYTPPGMREVYTGNIHLPAYTDVQAVLLFDGRLHQMQFPVYPPVHAPVAYTPVLQNCAVPDVVFYDFLQVMNSKSFESTRKTLAKNFLRENRINSRQARELLNSFTFESTKVEVAKLAYRRTVDPQFFYQTYDAFTFESSIRELDRYISRNG